MTTKEYLRQYIEADKSINRKLDQISRLRMLATKSTTVLSEGKVSCSLNNDKVADIVSKIVDMERELDHEIDILQGLRANVIKAITSVDDERLREILELRYINGMTWEKIAVETNYTYQWVCELHGKALQKVNLPT